MADILTGLTTGFGTAATTILSAIGDILPVVIPIAAAIVLISVGYRVFKKFAK